MSAASANHKTPIYKVLYFQVICAIVIGILLGFLAPEIGAQMKPFGDGFIRLIKMIIAPVIFCTVVTGIAGMEDMKKVGKTGGLALLYFEVVSTIALIIGRANASPICITSLVSRQCTEAPRQSFGTASASA